MGLGEVFAGAAVLRLNFKGSLGICYREKTCKRERKHCVFKSSEIHEGLKMGILMAPEKGDASGIMGTC